MPLKTRVTLLNALLQTRRKYEGRIHTSQTTHPQSLITRRNERS